VFNTAGSNLVWGTAGGAIVTTACIEESSVPMHNLLHGDHQQVKR
jgi:hypothetical protein